MAINISDLEKQAVGMTQMAFARTITFDFNPVLISLACAHWNDPSYEELLKVIVENRTLLENRKKPISHFFKRVGDKSLRGASVREAVRPCIKNGVHVMNSETLLTTEENYVSVNEKNYCLRVGPWFIHTENKLFSAVINENFLRSLMVVDRTFDLKVIAHKRDVESFENNIITLVDGRKFELLVV